jgi:hypothetical protein
VPRLGTLSSAAAAVLVALTLQACSLLGAVNAHSRVSTGPDGLRTFTSARAPDGGPLLCPAFGIIDHVHGALGGAVGGREPVWITTDDGRNLSVIWPAGFSVRFEPDAALYNESGVVVAKAGQPIELGQTTWTSATGSYDDPYLASGLVLGGCYPFVR